MTAIQSLKLYELTFEFIKDKEKAKEFVTKIEEAVDEKFVEKEKILATKQDISDLRKEISESKVDIIKWQVGTSIAIVGILIAILKLL